MKIRALFIVFIASICTLFSGCASMQADQDRAEFLAWYQRAFNEASAGSRSWAGYYSEALGRVSALPASSGQTEFIRRMEIMWRVASEFEDNRITEQQFRQAQDALRQAERQQIAQNQSRQSDAFAAALLSFGIAQQASRPYSLSPPPVQTNCFLRGPFVSCTSQ